MPADRTIHVKDDDFFQGLDRYEFLGTLGRGGMGVVYRVRDLHLDEEIAVKVLLPVEEVPPAELLARFKSEINLNRRIKHPNVARLHDYGIHESRPYLTMELIAGRDLGRVLAEDGPLPAGRALPILRQIALGTAAAHEAGIIHRDLKPQNIMVGDDGRVSILDFGLARSTKGTGITQLGTTVGTPDYMSPEQARGRKLDGRTDLYAIGAMAFEALTGRLPFVGDSALTVVMMHLHDPVPVDLLLARKLPPDLVSLITRCLAKAPEVRPQSAAELAARIATLERQNSDDPPARAPRDLEFGPPEPEPRQPSPADVPTPRKAMPVVQTGKERKPVILVVDDEAQIRELVSIFLGKSGCEVLQASDGPAALQAVDARPPDLILLDVNMPTIDGFDTARIIKASKAHAERPIVFMSSVLDRSRLAFANQTGAVDFISKPLDFPKLVQTVWRHLETQGF